GVGPEYFRAENIEAVEGGPINARGGAGLNGVVRSETVAKEKCVKGVDDVMGEIVSVTENPSKGGGGCEEVLGETHRGHDDRERIKRCSRDALLLWSMWRKKVPT